jgi:hypothetical protein
MTFFIEDLLRILMLGGFHINSRDQQMLDSFEKQISQDIGLTERQRSAAVRILRHHATLLDDTIAGPVRESIDTPEFKLPLRILKNAKRISIIDHPQHGRSIKMEFPYDEEKIKKIREQRENLSVTLWDPERSAWILSLEESAIRFLMDFAVDGDYEFDDEILDYLKQASIISSNIEDRVPMLVIKNNEIKIANRPENLPELESKDVISAVFEARKKGILTWDETINCDQSMMALPESIREFLNGDYDHVTLIDSQKISIDCLSDLVTHMTPCLFVIPGGSELEKISQAYDFLISKGIENNQISTMFRLPNDTGADFNNFVKNTGLNGPITEDTKIVFVSTKLPKSILKSKIRFNSVINMGTHSAHHTMREFMKNHENLVIFSGISTLKNIRDRLAW